MIGLPGADNAFPLLNHMRLMWTFQNHKENQTDQIKSLYNLKSCLPQRTAWIALGKFIRTQQAILPQNVAHPPNIWAQEQNKSLSVEITLNSSLVSQLNHYSIWQSMTIPYWSPRSNKNKKRWLRLEMLICS